MNAARARLRARVAPRGCARAASELAPSLCFSSERAARGGHAAWRCRSRDRCVPAGAAAGRGPGEHMPAAPRCSPALIPA